jgi:hypothetical protein
MATTVDKPTLASFDIVRTEDLAASIEVVFETLVENLGPYNETGDNMPMPMKFEPWPGGRWFRDLGNNMGHLWGHVQVIKPPALIEIYGPMFMSYPVMSHIQYRLTAEGKGTLLTLRHRAVGEIPKEHSEGVREGWGHQIAKVRERAERR